MLHTTSNMVLFCHINTIIWEYNAKYLHRASHHISFQINEELSQARHKIILNPWADTCQRKAKTSNCPQGVRRMLSLCMDFQNPKTKGPKWKDNNAEFRL